MHNGNDFDLSESERFNERAEMRNAIARALNYAIITILFLIACVVWYLTFVGTIVWYGALILTLTFIIIGLIHTTYTDKNLN